VKTNADYTPGLFLILFAPVPGSNKQNLSFLLKMVTLGFTVSVT